MSAAFLGKKLRISPVNPTGKMLQKTLKSRRQRARGKRMRIAKIQSDLMTVPRGRLFSIRGSVIFPDRKYWNERTWSARVPQPGRSQREISASVRGKQCPAATPQRLSHAPLAAERKIASITVILATASSIETGTAASSRMAREKESPCSVY